MEQLLRIASLYLIFVLFPVGRARIRRVEMYLYRVRVELQREFDGLFDLFPRLRRISNNVVGIRPDTELPCPFEGLTAEILPGSIPVLFDHVVNNPLAARLHAEPHDDTTGFFHESKGLVGYFVDSPPAHPGHLAIPRDELLTEGLNELAIG